MICFDLVWLGFMRFVLGV